MKNCRPLHCLILQAIALAVSEAVCRPKPACNRFTGAKCQPIQDPCQGNLLVGNKFCRTPTLCACCVPTAPSDLQVVPVVFADNGIADATSYWSPGGNEPIKAFQRGGGFWISDEPGTLPQSLWFKFYYPIRVVKYSFNSRPHPPYQTVEDGPTKYWFWASNSEDCDTTEDWWESGPPFTIDNAPKMEKIGNEKYYKCYGFQVNDVPGRPDGRNFSAIGNVRYWQYE